MERDVEEGAEGSLGIMGCVRRGEIRMWRRIRQGVCIE
jgi:hypothetical protein